MAHFEFIVKLYKNTINNLLPITPHIWDFFLFWIKEICYDMFKVQSVRMQILRDRLYLI